MRAAFAQVALFISVAAACGAARPKNETGELELLRNWALSRCIFKMSSSEADRDDAAKSASADLEMSDAGTEVFDQLDGLVDSFLRRVYSGSVPSSYNTMKCIDMFRSRELDELVRNAPK